MIRNYTEEEKGIGVEIVGNLQMLNWHNVPKLHLVSGDADIRTIGELINACGYTTKSVTGHKVLITIEDYKE